MATSGTIGFSPAIADQVDEAFERCLVDPATLTGRHLRSASRSISLMLSDWSNEHEHLPWKIETASQTMTDGDADFVDSSGAIAILSAVLRRDSNDIPMQLIGREEYELIPSKTTEGMPDRFKVTRGISSLTVTVWPTPENSTDVMRYQRALFIEEPGALSNTLDMPQNWQEAFASGLAAKLSRKFARHLTDALDRDAMGAFRRARYGSKDKASIYIGTANRRRGRR